MKKRSLLISFVVLVLGMNSASAAVQMPYTFKAGEAARAAEVNANFKALQDAIEQLQPVAVQLEALAKENRALKTTLADLQAQIGELKKQVAALQKPNAAVMPTPIPAAKGSRLRSKPLTVSDNAAQQQFNLTENWRPRRYIENDFKAQGEEIVIDHATGLMWQKSGSPNAMTYQEAQAYIEQLDRERFAGYANWRLPTVEELLSLMERDTQSKGNYIDPLFDSTQTWCWSADKNSSGGAWYVYFNYGSVTWNFLSNTVYVRAVRS